MNGALFFISYVLSILPLYNKDSEQMTFKRKKRFEFKAMNALQMPCPTCEVFYSIQFMRL